MRRKLIAGNWKMNGRREDGAALAGTLARRRLEAGPLAWDMLLCPPAQLWVLVGEAFSGSDVALGGQDCHSAVSGAHTGDISAEMLRDVGCGYVILGHSERRQNHGESDALVRAKATAAIEAALVPIVCVGETARERADGQALAVIERQIAGSLPAAEPFAIAYEPVWAIGTGKTATPADVAEVHSHIRELLRASRGRLAEEVRVLYGGSVKPDNAAELLSQANVDGALVGGASLDAEAFWAIGSAAPGEG
jgi:triosephosphate isomerase